MGHAPLMSHLPSSSSPQALMSDTHNSSLRNHFHSAPYSTIMETVSGLRGVAGHLIKVL